MAPYVTAQTGQMTVTTHPRPKTEVSASSLQLNALNMFGSTVVRRNMGRSANCR